MTTKQKELIQAATIARVFDRQSGKFLGLGVKSNSSSEYYCVKSHKDAQGQIKYTCTCKAGENNFANCKAGYCCHVLAVIELVEARKALKLEDELKQEQQAAVTEVEKHLQETRTSKVPARQVEDWGTPEEEYLRPGYNEAKAYREREEKYKALEKQRDEAKKTRGFSILAY